MPLSQKLRRSERDMAGEVYSTTLLG